MFLKTFWPFFSPASVCLGPPFCPPVPSPYPGAYGDEPWGLSSCTGFAYFLDAFPMAFKVHSRSSLNILHAVFKNRVQNVWQRFGASSHRNADGSFCRPTFCFVGRCVGLGLYFVSLFTKLRQKPFTIPGETWNLGANHQHPAKQY